MLGMAVCLLEEAGHAHLYLSLGLLWVSIDASVSQSYNCLCTRVLFRTLHTIWVVCCHSPKWYKAYAQSTWLRAPALVCASPACVGAGLMGQSEQTLWARRSRSDCRTQWELALPHADSRAAPGSQGRLGGTKGSPRHLAPPWGWGQTGTWVHRLAQLSGAHSWAGLWGPGVWPCCGISGEGTDILGRLIWGPGPWTRRGKPWAWQAGLVVPSVPWHCCRLTHIAFGKVI